MTSIRRALLTVCLSSAVVVSAHAAEPTRYTILLDNGTRVAGEEVDQQLPNGVTKVHFTFKDNGRGPELNEEFTLAPDGTFTHYRSRDTSTFGAPVDETVLARRPRLPSGASTSDQGEQEVSGSALYMPLTAAAWRALGGVRRAGAARRTASCR